MDHGMKKCEGIPHGDREKEKDELPYSITLKESFEIIDKVVVDKGESLVGLANPLEVDEGKRKVGLYESNEMTSGEFVGNLNKKIKYEGKATNGMVLGNSRLVSSGYESTHSYFGSAEAMTKINGQYMEKVRKRCDFMYGIDGELVRKTRIDWRFIEFYATPFANKRNSTWSLLRRLGHDQDFPWLNVFEECNLMDIGYSGVWLTWEREGEIKRIWETSTGSIFDKLEWLRHGLMVWAKSIKTSRNGLKNELNKKLVDFLGSKRTDDHMAKLIDTKGQLNLEIDNEEVLWEQRACVNWLRLGDKNTTFFHRYVLTRRKTNLANRLERTDGTKASSEEEIGEIATNFFHHLFTLGGVGDLTHLLSGIVVTISPDDNHFILSRHLEEEVYVALKEMRPIKTSGFDGFSTLFFQQYWNIVGNDILAYCLGILNEGKVPILANATDSLLIPKVLKPTSLANFRPINLCFVLYINVAKTVANRLQCAIGRCVDSAQSAFVPRRLSSDNVLLSYE
ncbi:hypothetical protein Goari_019550, partial [Gossypium aridum]|nr:hypothetical protein [Gossypium aridum]